MNDTQELLLTLAMQIQRDRFSPDEAFLQARAEYDDRWGAFVAAQPVALRREVLYLFNLLGRMEDLGRDRRCGCERRAYEPSDRLAASLHRWIPIHPLGPASSMGCIFPSQPNRPRTNPPDFSLRLK